jgi:pyrroloquinoline quinone biosynthesis protein B
VRVRVLGSAAGGGVPQWNCGCEACVAARRGDAALPARSQDSLAVSAEGQRWSLLNASPDVRDQLARFPGLHPRPGTRDIPLDTVVLTNPDLDHALGVLVMREALPHRVVTTPWVADALLEHNAVFRHIEPAWGRVKLDEPFALDRGGDLEARLFPVPGKVPSWCEGLANHPEATVGVRVTDLRSGRRMVYVPGARSLDAGARAELEAAALRFVDGTFWSDDELRRVRPGAPEARAMGHLPIAGAEGSLAFLATLPGRSFYVHLNNTNPALVTGSPEAAELARRGVGVAHDGLELEA